MCRRKIVIIFLIFLLLFCFFGCGTDPDNAAREREDNEVVVNNEIKITVNNETEADFTAWADGSDGVKIFHLKQGETLTIPAIIYDIYDNNKKKSEDYEFLGWYYKDKNNQECEFDQSKELKSNILNIDSNELIVYAKVKKIAWDGPY